MTHALDAVRARHGAEEAAAAERRAERAQIEHIAGGIGSSLRSATAVRLIPRAGDPVLVVALDDVEVEVAYVGATPSLGDRVALLMDSGAPLALGAVRGLPSD